jgi:nicotinamide riboside kinase
LSKLLINIIGAESTGKSTLTDTIAEFFNVDTVPEFARLYCSALTNHPNLEDIQVIVNQQIKEYELSFHSKKVVIFDTSLITSLIWMYDKYGVTDLRFHQIFLSQKFDLTLLCYPDIGWHPDPLRHDANRQLEIHEMYVNYMLQNNKKFHIISGSNHNREELAKKMVQSLI